LEYLPYSRAPPDATPYIEVNIGVVWIQYIVDQQGAKFPIDKLGQFEEVPLYPESEPSFAPREKRGGEKKNVVICRGTEKRRGIRKLCEAAG
jgi:hypothetical protein